VIFLLANGNNAKGGGVQWALVLADSKQNELNIHASSQNQIKKPCQHCLHHDCACANMELYFRIKDYNLSWSPKEKKNYQSQGVSLGCIFCPCQIIYCVLFGFGTLKIPLNYIVEV